MRAQGIQLGGVKSDEERNDTELLCVAMIEMIIMIVVRMRIQNLC